jgi:SAM-dependent methyltransferase
VSDPDEQRRSCLAQWDAASAGWGESQAWLRERAAPVSRWLIDSLELAPGQRLLELAAGPGETGLMAASLLAPGGALISSDQSAAMVELARARAAELGLDNVECRVINAESIALPVASVDAVLCRWGYMLMVDPGAALGETRRVLRSAGRLALAVWGSPQGNAWLTVPNGVLEEFGLVTPPDPEGPGVFALSDPVRLRRLLEDAGFTEIAIESVELDWGAASFEEWWERHLAMSPSGALVREADPELARRIAAEVAKRLDAKHLTATSLVAAASA